MLPVSSPILPARWAEILDNVQQALAQAEAIAAQSAQVLEPLAPEAAGQGTPNGLDAPGEPGRLMHASQARADLGASEFTAAIEASEAALRQWLARAEAIRRNLASTAPTSV